MWKTNLSKFKKALELILWITILSGVIFINLSPALLNIGRIQLTAVFSLFLLAFVFNRTITLTRFSPTKKIVLKTFIFLLFLYFVIYLFSFKIYELWIFYLLPVLLALSLSLAIVLQPRALTLALVAISIFLLGDIYWGMHLSATTAGINLPVIFSKVFSLSLLSILGYYLYRREQMATEELNILSQNLQKLNEELKLKTEELLRANKRLQELSEVKSRFVATVSHELRTPLTAILNSLKLIEYETKDNKEINEYLSLIKKNVDRQAIMIDNLLDLSKIERGHIEGVRTQVSLNRIVGEVIDLLKEKARDKNIHLLFEAKEDLPLIWADQEQVRRIFINLIDNGIKFTPSGGWVKVSLFDAGENIKAIVADNGPGIPQEEQMRIFEPFVQLEGGKGEGIIKRGIGLGLTIVKEIIDLHKGKIWVEAELGKGSKFFILLPKDLRKKES